MCALLAAHVEYCVPRMRWPVVFTLNARLQHDTQRWDLLLAKGGKHKSLSVLVWREGAAATVNGRGKHDIGVVQKESCYQLYT